MGPAQPADHDWRFHVRHLAAHHVCEPALECASRAASKPGSLGRLLARVGRPVSAAGVQLPQGSWLADRKSTRLNSSHITISYAVSSLKKKKLTHSAVWRPP